MDEHAQAMLLEAAPDAMVVADASGTIVMINVATERLFGYTARGASLGLWDVDPGSREVTANVSPT